MTIEEWAKDFKSYVNALDMPRDDYNGIIEYIDDAIDLLKEQEAVEPEFVDVNTWMCSKCGALLGWEEFSQFGLELIKYKYCPECGHEVKWVD